MIGKNDKTNIIVFERFEEDVNWIANEGLITLNANNTFTIDNNIAERLQRYFNEHKNIIY